MKAIQNTSIVSCIEVSIHMFWQTLRRLSFIISYIEFTTSVHQIITTECSTPVGEQHDEILSGVLGNTWAP